MGPASRIVGGAGAAGVAAGREPRWRGACVSLALALGSILGRFARVTMVPCSRPEHHAPAHLPDELLRALLRERSRFLSFARRRLHASDDAEDVFQEALARASSRLGGLRDCGALEAWFFRVLRTVAFDHAARVDAEARKRAALALEAAPDATAPPHDTCACSLRELENLSDAYREILTRVVLHEEPLGDAANALGVTPNSAGVRLHRARHALRGALAARCGTTSSSACLDCGCDDRPSGDG